MMRAPAALAFVVTFAVACDEPPPLPTVSAPRPVAAPVPAPVAPASAAAALPLFGLGRAPTAAELGAIDVDVAPDGTGLPAGGGSAREAQWLYAAKCAACHGPDGASARYGRLIGRKEPVGYKLGRPPDGQAWVTVGNYWPYATTLFDYVRRSMPLHAPGSLSANDAYSVTAWILWKNGLLNEETRLDAASLPKIEMPARARYVPADASAR